MKKIRGLVNKYIKTTDDTFIFMSIVVVACGLFILYQAINISELQSQLRTVKEAYANLLQACP